MKCNYCTVQAHCYVIIIVIVEQSTKSNKDSRFFSGAIYIALQ